MRQAYSVCSLFCLFAFPHRNWAILLLLTLLCLLLLNFLLCLFVFTVPHQPTYTPHTPPVSSLSSTLNTTLLLCSQPVPAALASEQHADSRQSLTRLFSAAAALTADDPLDLFHGILMWFDMQRGLCRSHNTCLNTHSLWLTGAHLAC